MTEKTKAPLTVAKGTSCAQVQKTEAAKPVKTLQELEKENEELRKKLNSVPADLDKKIEYFNRKRQLIKKFDALELKRENLFEHLTNIAEISAKNDFTNDRYSLIIMNADGGYNAKEVFKMQNPVIIGDVLNFVAAKIEAKQAEIKKQIEE